MTSWEITANIQWIHQRFNHKVMVLGGAAAGGARAIDIMLQHVKGVPLIRLYVP